MGDKLTLKRLEDSFSVCKIESLNRLNLSGGMFFLAKTDEELSLVCPGCEVPEGCTAREDGWKGMRVEGILDFSLIGILSDIASVLAREGISIFAVSTYNTDYIFVKEKDFQKAEEALTDSGYTIS